MKAKLLMLYALTALTINLACSREEKNDFAHLESDTIPIGEALTKLNNTLALMGNETKCDNAYCTYSKSTVICVGSRDFTNTKAANNISIPDSLFYMVNFDDESGFAILSANRRLSDDIYCITEKGSIRASDMQRAFDFLHTKAETTKSSNEEISFYDMGKDFVPTIILSSMLADLKYGKISDEQDTKTPIATTNSILLKTKWGQGAPYNMYLNECATGCVSTACAQIMEYCKVPPHPIFDDIQCNWKTMELVRNVDNMYDDDYPETAKRQVGHLFHAIGTKKNCNISYGKESSSGYASGVVRTLKNYGYYGVTKHLGFRTKNQNRVSDMISKGYPVYIDGSDFHHGGGHAWVIDGEWNGYFHCNWGWDGYWDGYYAKHNYFPVDYREYIDSKDTDGHFSTNRDYDWDFSIITYSTPY